MKYLAVLVAVGMVSVSAVAAKNSGKHLFILSGQSNMGGLDPALSFTPTVEKEFGKENVTVVKNAKGGQPIRRWYKDYQYPDKREIEDKSQIGDLYDALMNDVKAAIEGKSYDTVTFVWMQGERDAKESLADVYANSFNGILDQLKKDLELKEINFVIGRLSDHCMTNTKFPHWTKMRDVQVKLAEDDKNGAWVDTDDLNGGKDGVSGGLHYKKPEGYKTLGKRFADKSIELIRKK